MADSKFETAKGTLKEYGNVLQKGEYHYRSVTVSGKDEADIDVELAGKHWSKDKKTLEAYESLKGQEVEYSYTAGTEKSDAKLRVYPIKTDKEKAEKAKSGGGSNWNNPEKFAWERARAAVNDPNMAFQDILGSVAPFYVEMYKNKSAQDTTKLIDAAAFVKLAVERSWEIQQASVKAETA